MQITAAVASRKGAPLDLQTLSLDEPRPDEVRVRFVATGICHTDAIIRDQVYPTPLPAVLGHEGAGVVEHVGSAVTGISVGDHVVCSANSCGTCRQCLTGRLAYCEDLFARNFGGRRADGSTSLTGSDSQRISSNFFGQSSFSTAANVAARSVVPVDRDIDLTLLGPLGCGLQTGAGAVLNELRPAPGSIFVVFGAGAVGLAAVMAAASTGCADVVAVDVVDSRLELAATVGATHTINSRSTDVSSELIRCSNGRGIDYVLDTTGRPEVLRTAADHLAVGGTLALVGSSLPGTEVPFEIGESLNRGWTFKTIIQGGSVPQVFIPALIAMWRRGRFPFDRLITQYDFADINTAFADSESGRTIKPVIVYP